jgi:hypothetical protein
VGEPDNVEASSDSGGVDSAPQSVGEPVPQSAGKPALPRWGLLSLLAVGMFALGFALSRAPAFMVGAAQRALWPSSTTTVVRGSSAIVTAIRDLATLETASYHMERVIDLRDKQSHLFGLFESEDAVLLVAASDVIAGVDLTSMHDGDIVFDPIKQTARVTLPPPIILSSHLDSERTYVHSRQTDALARRAEALETRARIEAEHTLRDAAIEAGILQRARNNAARTIQTLVQSLGFTVVEIDFRSE